MDETDFLKKIDLIKRYQREFMQIKAFNTAIVPVYVISKQMEYLPCKVSSALCLSDYGEYVSHLKHKYGNDCKVYCCPTTYHGYLMCIDALSVYDDNPVEFVIFNKEKCSSLTAEYFEDILKEKNMQFDIVVGNPPYGEDKPGSNRFLHLQIMNTVLKFCKYKLVFIMPSKPVIQQLDDRWYNMLKNAVCNKIEIMNKEVFKNTEMDNTAIYYCDRYEDPNNYCKKLDVDKTLYESLSEGGRLFVDKMTGESVQIFIAYNLHGNKVGSDYFRKEMDRIYNRLHTGKYYLNVNRANGSFGAKWLSGTMEKIGVLTKDEEMEFCKEHTKTKNIVECPNKEYGENLKNLMVNGLVLRYGLWLTQIKQPIVQTQFKYVLSVDYTNIHTDEELLSACGFTPDEIEKTMDYLRRFDFSKNRNDVVRDYTGCEVETDEDK